MNNENKNIEESNTEKSTQTPKLTIGNYLKKLREEKNHTQESISEITKINQTILKSLENDDFNNLPQRPYIAGFIKSYCKALGKDHSEALQVLAGHYEVEKPKKQQPEQRPETTKPMLKTPMGVGKYIIAALIFLGAFIAYQIVQQNEIEEQESKRLQGQEVLTIANRPKVIEEQKEIVEILETENVAVEATKKEVKKEVKEEIKKEKVKEEKKEEEEKEITFRNMPKNLFTLSALTKEDKLPSKATNVKEGEQIIYIQSEDSDNWITFQRDDQKPIKYILKAGRDLLIKGKRILLFMGNINAVKLYSNGQRVTAKTRSGVKSLVFPETISQEYSLPLFIFHKNGTVSNSKTYQENLKTE